MYMDHVMKRNHVPGIANARLELFLMFKRDDGRLPYPGIDHADLSLHGEGRSNAERTKMFSGLIMFWD